MPIDRRAVLQRQVHHFANFVRDDAAQAAAEDGKILRINIHQTAVDGAVTGHHRVAEKFLLVQAEIRAVVRAQSIELDETAAVEQNIEALARQ